MTKNRRSVMFIIILIFALISQSFVVAQSDVVTVTLWIGNTLQSKLDFLNENLVIPFEQAHPNIQLEISGRENLSDLLRTSILGGNAPDILSTAGPAWNAEYIDGGFMASLEPYVEQYGWKDKLLPWAYATGTINDVLYNIPTSYETMIMFYNKTLFETNGWTVPTNRAELEAVAAQAEALGIYPFTYGNQGAVFANGHLLTAYLNNYVEQNDLRSALVGDKNWTDQVFVDAINLLNSDIVDKSWWSGGVENYY